MYRTKIESGNHANQNASTKTHPRDTYASRTRAAPALAMRTDPTTKPCACALRNKNFSRSLDRNFALAERTLRTESENAWRRKKTTSDLGALTSSPRFASKLTG
nr:MAG: hypothetical protein AmFV_00074 [Apis mellifera filamentous virus]WOK43178.1 MAG: hypothetical protein [Apis mellifera filamentous virus]